MLKKSFIFFIIFFLSSFFVQEDVKAEKIYDGEYLPLYVNKVKNGKIRYQQARFLRRESDRQTVYCIEPWEVISSSVIYENGEPIVNLSDPRLTRLGLIVRYGYNHTNHTEAKWYYITQVLLWREIDPEADFYFTNTLNGSRIDTYEENMQEILDLVNTHYQQPKFAEEKIQILLGDEIIISDQNQVLNKFSLSFIGDRFAQKLDGNKLKIMGQSVGKQVIEFRKTDDIYSGSPLIYKSDTHQDFLSMGDYKSLISQIYVDVVTGSITIEKKGKPGISGISSDSTLIGSKFIVQNDKGEIIETITMNESLQATISNLPKGTYTIREIEAGTGYQVSEEVKTITLSNQNVHSKVIFENELIEKKIIIEKYYGNSNQWWKEENVTFEVYNEKEKLVKTLITNKEGKIEFYLPYGTFTVKQKTSKENYVKVDDWKIEIIDNKTENKILYDQEITGKVIVKKVDSKTHEPIEHAPTYFKIQNLDTGKWLEEIFKTNENGLLEISSLSFGKYKLTEIEAATNYQLSDEEYFFEINGNLLNVYLEIENEQIIKVPDTETNWKGESKIEIHVFPNYNSNSIWNLFWKDYLTEDKKRRFHSNFFTFTKNRTCKI